jgi:hypothetical protein
VCGNLGVSLLAIGPKDHLKQLGMGRSDTQSVSDVNLCTYMTCRRVDGGSGAVQALCDSSGLHGVAVGSIGVFRCSSRCLGLHYVVVGSIWAFRGSSKH